MKKRDFSTSCFSVASIWIVGTKHICRKARRRTVHTS
jgi:hypothetical protein